MTRIDLKRQWKQLYAPGRRAVVEVDVPAFNFLMIDGEGDPNTAPAYQQAVEALYTVSYTVKFQLRKARGIDFAVMPLEGLWWAEDMRAFTDVDKRRWKWTMMIMQPPEVSAADIQTAIATAARKKPNPALAHLRFESFPEGRCAQILHVGPFSEEGPTIRRVHDYIAARGALRGKHHEIYLSDIRRAAPERWKTVIRQPMHEPGR